MDRAEFTSLERLVQSGDFAAAEQLCGSILTRSDGERWQFWKTQLAYISFLNEMDDGARYDRAPAHLDALIHRFPGDTNARFWSAYLDHILFSDAPSAEIKLRAVLSSDAEHAYAALVLAGLSQDPSESIELLRRVLAIQPGNARALLELSQLQVLRGDFVGAAHSVQRLLSGPPYREHSYGIMNTYINDVLSGAARAGEWRVNALHNLESVKKNQSF